MITSQANTQIQLKSIFTTKVPLCLLDLETPRPESYQYTKQRQMCLFGALQPIVSSCTKLICHFRPFFLRPREYHRGGHLQWPQPSWARIQTLTFFFQHKSVHCAVICICMLVLTYLCAVSRQRTVIFGFYFYSKLLLLVCFRVKCSQVGLLVNSFDQKIGGPISSECILLMISIKSVCTRKNANRLF